MKGNFEKLLSIILAMVMLCGIFAAPAQARVGSLSYPDGTWSYGSNIQYDPTVYEGTTPKEEINNWKVTSGTTEYNGKTLYYLKNGYMYFAIDETGLRTYTSPAALLDNNNLFGGMDKLYQDMEFSIERVGLQTNAQNIQKYKEKTIRAELEELSWTTGSSDSPESGNIPAIYVKYSFPDEPKLSICGIFELVNVEDGRTFGQDDEEIYHKTEDSGKTWAVVGKLEAHYTGTKQEDGENWSFNYTPGAHDNGERFEGKKVWITKGTVIRWKMNMNGFPVMGHGDIADEAPKVIPMLNKVNNKFHSNTKLNKSVSKTEVEFAEIYTDQYMFANPFSLGRNWESYSGAAQYPNQGWSSWKHSAKSELSEQYSEYLHNMAREYSYTHNANKAYQNKLVSISKVEGMQEYNHSAITQMWGFRDLLLKDNYDPQDVAAIAPPPETANRLAVFKVDGGLKVLSAKDDDALAELKKTYGNPIHTIRGEFEEIKGNDGKFVYMFSDGVAALTPTITAGWTDGSLSMTEDGVIDQDNISLSTPTFTFYKPKSGANNNLSLSIDADGKYIMTFADASLNDAFIYVDIPYATVKMESATADAAGNIILEGKIGIRTVFDGAYFDMEKLGYGMKNKEFKVNGVKASAGFNTASLIGMDIAEVTGAINTFPGEEEYDFRANLNVFDLFTAEAEINVQALKDGTLIPNKVWAYVKSDIQGIPLVYPVVVAELKGGGLGFDNLATTLKGNFIAVPPLTLKIKATGSILELASGSVTGEVGPGSYSITYSDLELLDLPTGMDRYTNVIEEIGWNVGIEGQERSYKNKNYTGLYLHGGAHADFNVLDVIKAGGSFQLNAFAGLDSYKLENIDRSLYLMVGADGSIYGQVVIPGDVPVIGGKKIVGADLDVSLGAQTAITLQEFDIKNIDDMLINAGKSAYENLDVYGGIAFTGDFIVAKARVYYVLPDRLGYDVAAGWNDLPEWNWEDYKGDGEIKLFSTAGEQVGLMGVEMNIEPLALTQSSSGSYSPGITGSEEGNLLLMVTPSESYTGTMEEFTEALTISGVTINVAPSDGSEIEAKELSNYNAIITKNGEGKPSLIVNLGDIQEKGYDNTSSWDITNTADTGFGATFSVSKELTSLDASLNERILNATVLNPVSNTKYVLRTYLGTEKGGTDFLIDQTEIDSSASGVSYTIPQSGTAVPTGNYYVSTFLLEEVEGDFDTEHEGTEKAWIPVADKAFDGYISYTNSSQPSAPTNVTVASVGNEVMRGTWNGVTDADGYEIAVLQKNSEGVFVETGKGYSFDVKSDGTPDMDGVSYDAASSGYSLDMALTVGDGESVLEADNDYKISVKAYRYQKDDDEVKTTQKIFSTASESAEANLPKYVPLDFTFGKKERDPENPYLGDIFVPVHPNADGEIIIKNPGGVVNFVGDENDKNVTYTAMYLDGEGNEVNLNVVYWNEDNEGYVDFISTDIPSKTLIYVTGTTQNGDKTTKIITVEEDEIAPVVILTSDSFNADANGIYKVTGMTEPGISVKWEQSTGATANLKANSDGRFLIEGTLADPAVGEVIVVSATDEAGNESLQAQADIGVGYAPEIPESELPEQQTPSRPSSGGGVTRYTVKFDTDGAEEIKSVTVARNNKIAEPATPTKDGYVFDGWYSDKDFTEKYDFESKVIKSFTLYAKWILDEEQTQPAEPTEWKNPFTDVKENDWYYEYVQFAYENGLMKGTSETEFAPDLELTRGMFVTILYRLDSEPDVNRSIPFADISANDYFANAVIWAEQNDIVNGVTETEFAPNANITREQMAAIIYRYAQFKGYDVTALESTNILSYEDFDDISEWAIEAMQYSSGAGLIKGRTESTLNPQDNATRAETAAILMRFIEGNVK